MGVERKAKRMEKFRAKANFVLIFRMAKSEVPIFG